MKGAPVGKSLNPQLGLIYNFPNTYGVTLKRVSKEKLYISCPQTGS